MLTSRLKSAPQPPIPFDRVTIPHHLARQVNIVCEALDDFSSISVQIDLATYDRFPRCQGPEMVAGGERVAGSTLTPCATSSGHLGGIDRI